jgi:hypothetical protein
MSILEDTQATQGREMIVLSCLVSHKSVDNES